MSDSQVFMENGTVAHQPKMQMPLGNEILPKETTMASRLYSRTAS